MLNTSFVDDLIDFWYFNATFSNISAISWLAATSDKVYQMLAHGRWFSPGTPTSSTTKTGCLDIQCS
jgi:hypothetical protein